MNNKSSTQIILGALNLLAVSSPMLASHSLHAAVADQKIEQLNVASLKSIESTWLEVPNACKARGFNASPVSLEHKAVSASVQNIYSSFEA